MKGFSWGAGNAGAIKNLVQDTYSLCRIWASLSCSCNEKLAHILQRYTKKNIKKVPTLSHTTTRTTTTATTATSRKKKSNKNFYVMSLSLICGTCPPRPCTAQCTAQTTGAPRTSALNKTGDASCLKGDYRVRRGRERKEGLPLGWVWGTGLCTELLCLIWP